MAKDMTKDMTKGMTKTEAKMMAQNLLMEQLTKVGYCQELEDLSEADRDLVTGYCKTIGDGFAKKLGYKEFWFY